MIALEEARELAAAHPVYAGTEKVELEASMNRVLAEDVHADRDVPPFRRSTMDGYACRREDLPGPLEVLETDCRFFTPYAVLLRYPGLADDPSEEEGRQAVAAGERVHQRVQAVLSQAPDTRG